MNDLELATSYQNFIKFGAAKEWRKWSHLPDSHRPFDAAQVDQWALEAVLIMGGQLSSTRKLQSLEQCSGRASWIQHNIDLYVSDKAAKAFKAARVAGRTADVYLDEPLEDGTDTLGTLVLADLSTDSPDALGPLADRFPTLYANAVLGERMTDIARRRRVALTTLRAQRDAEVEALRTWAIRHRRILS